MAYTYSVAALVAAHQALLDLIDAGTGAAKVQIYDSTPTLLATITLTDPAGSVDGGTGQLTLVQGTREESAPAGGTADHAVIRDSDDTAILTVDCQAGTEAVSGYLVLNTLTIVAGGPVEISSLVIG